MAPPKRVVAIVNPATGHRAAQARITEARAATSDGDVTFVARLTERPGHAVALAREGAEHAQLLLAVGGDGTVSDVVTGAVGADVQIGIIPAGSTNMVSKDLGIPQRTRDAMQVALHGREMRVDIARANDTTFVHMAGAGYDAEIMRRAGSKWKRRVGWLAYLPPAISQARYPAFKARLVVDGVEYRGRARMILLALGAGIITPRFKVGAGIDRCDGQIDICIFNPPGIVATLATLGWIALGKPERSRWQRQLRGRSIELNADRRVPFEVDGDYLTDLPVTIEVLDARARIMTPSSKPRRRPGVSAREG
jgi:YegS/Rv2252/BmrU family lipid kinase